MALNVEGSHFGIGDLNSFRVEALVDVAVTVRPVLVVVAPISWMMTGG